MVYIKRYLCCNSPVISQCLDYYMRIIKKEAIRLSCHGQIFEKFKFVKVKKAWKASLKEGVSCKLPLLVVEYFGLQRHTAYTSCITCRVVDTF